MKSFSVDFSRELIETTLEFKRSCLLRTSLQNKSDELEPVFQLRSLPETDNRLDFSVSGCFMMESSRKSSLPSKTSQKKTTFFLTSKEKGQKKPSNDLKQAGEQDKIRSLPLLLELYCLLTALFHRLLFYDGILKEELIAIKDFSKENNFLFNLEKKRTKKPSNDLKQAGERDKIRSLPLLLELYCLLTALFHRLLFYDGILKEELIAIKDFSKENNFLFNLESKKDKKT